MQNTKNHPIPRKYNKHKLIIIKQKCKTVKIQQQYKIQMNNIKKHNCKIQ